MYRRRNWRWPFAVGMVRTDWTFQWTRAGKLLAIIDMGAVVADQILAARLEGYLRNLVKWTRE